jgi:polar amino acid transport system substrate-binding protein
VHLIFLKILIIVLSFTVASQAWSLDKLKVAFGDALAPWVMPDTNNGIILDLISEALEPLGYTIEPIYYPYARRIKSYKLGLVDVACDMNLNTIKNENLSGFFSDEAYTYENFAFSLKEKGYQFKHLNELGNLRLLSWQGAITHLGDEYAKMASSNPFYSEHHDQELQIKMLFLKRVDVVQLDKQIFKYYRTKVSKKGDINTTEKVDRFTLFGKSPNGFLFRSVKIRDEFNQQLKILKDSGQYAAIFERY